METKYYSCMYECFGSSRTKLIQNLSYDGKNVKYPAALSAFFILAQQDIQNGKDRYSNNAFIPYPIYISTNEIECFVKCYRGLDSHNDVKEFHKMIYTKK